MSGREIEREERRERWREGGREGGGKKGEEITRRTWVVARTSKRLSAI